MNTNITRMRRAIMRRVYMIYAGRVLAHPITINLALFVVALSVFRELVFVKRVLETLANMPLKELPHFFTDALWRGEVLTLLALGVMVFAALSINIQLSQLLRPRRRTAMA